MKLKVKTEDGKEIYLSGVVLPDCQSVDRNGDKLSKEAVESLRKQLEGAELETNTHLKENDPILKMYEMLVCEQPKGTCSIGDITTGNEEEDDDEVCECCGRAYDE